MYHLKWLFGGYPLIVINHGLVSSGVDIMRDFSDWTWTYMVFSMGPFDGQIGYGPHSFRPASTALGPYFGQDCDWDSGPQGFPQLVTMESVSIAECSMHYMVYSWLQLHKTRSFQQHHIGLAMADFMIFRQHKESKKRVSWSGLITTNWRFTAKKYGNIWQQCLKIGYSWNLMGSITDTARRRQWWLAKRARRLGFPFFLGG